MKKQDDYMDQLFKDHFEDFAQSPGEAVWKGVVANGTMANGKKLGHPVFWKAGFVFMTLVMLIWGGFESNRFVQAGRGHEQHALAMAVSQQMDGLVSRSERLSREPINNNEFGPASSAGEKTGQNTGPATIEFVEEKGAYVMETRSSFLTSPSGQGRPAPIFPDKVMHRSVIGSSIVNPQSPLAPGMDYLGLNHLQQAASWISLNDPLSVKVRRDLARAWANQQPNDRVKGGHWFVSGAFVADASLHSHRQFVLGFDGLAFGAGKYLSPDSFVEVSLRGAWDHGFNMRATYARLFLPGKLRPFAHGGLTLGQRLNLRVGLGLLYTPENLDKWRFYATANYEGIMSREGRGRAGILEIGAQFRLSGTEPLLSDNNWMNSVPLYKLPQGWYAEASAIISFEHRTQLTQLSGYMGKYLRRRLYFRGGVRLDGNRVKIPAQVQYHFLVRKKLQAGAYTGAALNTQNFRLEAELGLIAYYEVMPRWSLFVAPVVLEGADYGERLFETGVRFSLGEKE
jgi:hypothetical protein